MGVMPPYDPFADASLRWAVVRVESVEPAQPTNGRPATLTLAVEEVLRGELPPRVSVPFGAPREAGDERFYITRGLGPPPWTPEMEARVAAQFAALDARPVEVPDVGARVVIWLARESDGTWAVPTLRTLGAATLVPMRSRWIEAPHVERVRAHFRTG